MCVFKKGIKKLKNKIKYTISATQKNVTPRVTSENMHNQMT